MNTPAEEPVSEEVEATREAHDPNEESRDLGDSDAFDPNIDELEKLLAETADEEEASEAAVYQELLVTIAIQVHSLELKGEEKVTASDVADVFKSFYLGLGQEDLLKTAEAIMKFDDLDGEESAEVEFLESRHDG